MRYINILCLSLIFTPLFLNAQEIDVILIGGQSNATGQGYIRNIPKSFEVDTTVLFYYSKYLNRGEGSMIWSGLCQASETKDKFGIELSLGSRLQTELPQKKFALIKHALSGSNLYAQWSPGNREGEEIGKEYLKFITTVKKGLGELREKGYKPIIKAMVWQQGEADARFDAGVDNTQNYAKNLNNFICQVRKEFNQEDMVFVYGEVMPLPAERFSGRDIIRAAQIAVSERSNSEFSLDGAFLVEGDDLQMRSDDYRTPMPKDDVHLGTFGILTLGERFAEVISREIK